ncbi:MAG: 16S rRNA (uracil(1498)-N(3))-methyltransferase [Psittacicella sp.]
MYKLRIPRLYVEDILEVGNRILLDEDNVNYIKNVLKLSLDSQVILFNGEVESLCVIQELLKKKCFILVQEIIRVYEDSKLNIDLAQVISKGDRFEFVLQKSTELGVSKIIPLTSKRCNVILNKERQGKKLIQWSKMLIQASQQSGRIKPPAITSVVDLRDFIDSLSNNYDAMFILDFKDSVKLDKNSKFKNILLLIGPEGGLTQDEIEYVKSKGFSGLTLGPRVLRTETASLTSLSILQYVYGDLS